MARTEDESAAWECLGREEVHKREVEVEAMVKQVHAQEVRAFSKWKTKINKKICKLQETQGELMDMIGEMGQSRRTGTKGMQECG